MVYVVNTTGNSILHMSSASYLSSLLFVRLLIYIMLYFHVIMPDYPILYLICQLSFNLFPTNSTSFHIQRKELIQIVEVSL